jgi:hypothetical protein
MFFHVSGINHCNIKAAYIHCCYLECWPYTLWNSYCHRILYLKSGLNYTIKIIFVNCIKSLIAEIIC